MAENVPDQEGASGGPRTSAAATFVRAPQQERSRRTLKRILAAGLYLLEHQGRDALTVTGITKRAHTSVGSFYARFRGKDDLLRYLGERSLTEALEVWEQLNMGLQVGGELRASVTEVVQRLGWLYLEAAGRSLVLLDGIEDSSPTRRRRLEDRIASNLRELGVASEVRSNLATRILAGTLQDWALRDLRDSPGDEEGSPYPEASVLLSELVELLVGYLGGEVRATAVPTVHEPEQPPEPVPQPEVAVVRELPKREIATEALIEAALAPEPIPSSAPATRKAAKAQVAAASAPEYTMEPGPVEEPKRAAKPEPKADREAPSSEEPNPFDGGG